MDTNVLYSPRITEKSDRLKGESNQYIFRVAKTANKLEIARAVEALGKDIIVESVRTSVVPGKPKRAGRTFTRTASWKKAIVTLKEGSKLEYFEGV